MVDGPLHQPAPERAEQQPVVPHGARPDVPAAYLVLVSAALEVAFGTLVWVGGGILDDRVRQRSAERHVQTERGKRDSEPEIGWAGPYRSILGTFDSTHTPRIYA